MNRIIKTKTATDNPICPINVAAPFSRTYAKATSPRPSASDNPPQGKERPYPNAMKAVL